MTKTIINTYIEIEDRDTGDTAIFNINDKVGISNFGANYVYPEVIRTFKQVDIIKISIFNYLVNR